MTESYLTLETDRRGVATLRLNRPEVHNAFDDRLIEEMIKTLKRVDQDDDVRVLVFKSEGKHFSAGADINWMKRMAEYTPEENRADAMRLAELMRTLNFMNKPVLTLVQGAAFGGAVGLVACSDIVVAADDAIFSLSEVRLGIIPAVISPYVTAAIGQSASRRYCLSGERFGAQEALRIGLAHEVVPRADLESKAVEIIAELLKCGPQAQRAAKDLVFAVSSRPIDQDIIEDTADRITKARSSAEGQEGLGAFLEKRAPAWIKDN